jgi:hypothetical protein
MSGKLNAARVAPTQEESFPKFIDTGEAIEELSAYDSFEPAPDDL